MSSGRLSQTVSWVLCSCDVLHSKEVTGDTLTNVQVLDVDVLDALRRNWVLGSIDGGLVVDKQGGFNPPDEAGDKALDPDNFLTRAGGEADLSLHGGQADGFLKGALPSHEAGT